MSLAVLGVVDVYLGDGFADYTQHSGGDAARVPFPAEYSAQVLELHERCHQLRTLRDEDEFSLVHDGDLYRVTVFPSVDRGAASGAPIYFLSRGTAAVLPLSKIGVPAPIRDVLLDPATTGLVVIAGPRGGGKTTTAASILTERLQLTGGLALALQDPIETMLDGLHGNGRCIQSPISRRFGGYGEALTKAMRTRVGTILLGEIREAGTAALAIESGLSGIYLLSTLHGDPKESQSLRSSLNRLLTFATKDVGSREEAMEMLSASLSVLIQQRLEPIAPRSTQMRAVLTCLNFHDSKDGPALRAMVRDGRLDQLQTIAEGQAKRTLWTS